MAIGGLRVSRGDRRVAVDADGDMLARNDAHHILVTLGSGFDEDVVREILSSKPELVSDVSMSWADCLPRAHSERH